MKKPEKGDIMIVNLSPTIGHEQGGTRPVVVISNDKFNESGLVLICPITSRTRGNFFEVVLSNKKTQGFILAYHLRSIDYTARKAKIVDKVNAGVLEEVIDKVQILLS